MMTKAKLQQLAQAVGATVEEDRTAHYFTVSVRAPRYYTWNSDTVHEMVEQCCTGDAHWYSEARKEMASRMALGLSKCETLMCDFCDEEGT